MKNSILPQIESNGNWNSFQINQHVKRYLGLALARHFPNWKVLDLEATNDTLTIKVSLTEAEISLINSLIAEIDQSNALRNPKPAKKAKVCFDPSLLRRSVARRRQAVLRW